VAATSDVLLALDDAFAAIKAASSGVDEARGVRLLNRIMRYFEVRMAKRRQLFQEFGTITATAATETTSVVSVGFLRLDELWYIDPDTSDPRWPVEPVHKTGDIHSAQGSSIWEYIGNTANPGKVRNYSWIGDNIHWRPKPDVNQTIRWYGFVKAADMTISPDSTFPYPDAFIMAFAELAAHFFAKRVVRPSSTELQLAEELLNAALEGEDARWSDRPKKMSANRNWRG